MNLNQIRILEASYAYLVSKTNSEVEKTLKSENLIFRYESKMYKFKTYQAKSDNYTFIDYSLGIFELDHESHEIRIYDLYNSFDLKENELSILSNISDTDIVRSQIFKLLNQIDFAYLEEKYSKLKTDSYAYNVHILEVDKLFPVYKFPELASFDLVGIA